MPRMSREKRLEWSFFLNHRNRIAYNALCRSCTHDCKQSFGIVAIRIEVSPLALSLETGCNSIVA